MKKHFTILSSIITFTALAAFTPVSDSDGFYRINTEQSSVVWTGTKITGSSHSGKVKVQEGGLQVADGAVTGGKFTIDMTSIESTDLEGEMKGKLEGHLKNADFFNVAEHKTANLTITSTNANTVNADLTIKGITKPVTFPATVTIDGNTVTVTATIEVDRTKFDVRYGSDSFFDNLGNKAIENIIKFKVTLKGAIS